MEADNIGLHAGGKGRDVDTPTDELFSRLRYLLNDVDAKAAELKGSEALLDAHSRMNELQRPFALNNGGSANIGRAVATTTWRPAATASSVTGGLGSTSQQENNDVESESIVAPAPPSRKSHITHIPGHLDLSVQAQALLMAHTSARDDQPDFGGGSARFASATSGLAVTGRSAPSTAATSRSLSAGVAQGRRRSLVETMEAQRSAAEAVAVASAVSALSGSPVQLHAHLGSVHRPAYSNSARQPQVPFSSREFPYSAAGMHISAPNANYAVTTRTAASTLSPVGGLSPGSVPSMSSVSLSSASGSGSGVAASPTTKFKRFSGFRSHSPEGVTSSNRAGITGNVATGPQLTREQQLWMALDDLQADLRSAAAAAAAPVAQSGSTVEAVGPKPLPSSASMLAVLRAKGGNGSSPSNQHTASLSFPSPSPDPLSSNLISLCDRIDAMKETVLQLEEDHRSSQLRNAKQTGDDEAFTAASTSVSAPWVEKWKAREEHWRSVVDGLKLQLSSSLSSAQQAGVAPGATATPSASASASSSSSTVQVVALQIERDDALRRLLASQEQVARLHSDVDALQETISGLGYINANLNSALQTAHQEYEALRSEDLEKQAVIGKLQEALARLSSQLDDSQRQATSAAHVEGKVVEVTREAREHADAAMAQLRELRGQAARAVQFIDAYAAAGSASASDLSVDLRHAGAQSLVFAESGDDADSIAALAALQLPEKTQQLIESFNARSNNDASTIATLKHRIEELKKEGIAEIRRLRALYEGVTGAAPPHAAAAVRNADADGPSSSSFTDWEQRDAPFDFSSNVGESRLDGSFAAAIISSENGAATGQGDAADGGRIPSHFLALAGLDSKSRFLAPAVTSSYSHQAASDAAQLQSQIVECEVRIADLRAALANAEQRAAAAQEGHTQAQLDLEAVGAAAGVDVSALVAARAIAHPPQTTSIGYSTSMLRSSGRRGSASSSGSVDPQPSIISPAHLALLIAACRADERDRVLRDVQAAAVATNDHVAAGQDLMMAAQAGKVSAERECERLLEQIQLLATEWEDAQAMMQSAQAAANAMRSEALNARDASIREIDRARASEHMSIKQREHIEEDITRERSEHARELSVVAQQRLILEDSIASLQAQLLDAQSAVATMKSQRAQIEHDHAQALREIAAKVRHDTEAIMLERNRQEIEAVTTATARRAEGEAALRQAAALADQRERLLQQFEHDMSKFRLQQAFEMGAQAEIFTEEKAVAVQAAIEGTREDERRAADLRLSSIESEARRRVDIALQEASQSIANARSESSSKIMAAEREASARVSAARTAIDEMSEAHAQHLHALEHRLDHYREVARREVTRRRRMQSKIMDLQGNIRVHVRVRPTEAQVQAMRGAERRGVRDDNAVVDSAAAGTPPHLHPHAAHTSAAAASSEFEASDPALSSLRATAAAAKSAAQSAGIGLAVDVDDLDILDADAQHNSSSGYIGTPSMHGRARGIGQFSGLAVDSPSNFSYASFVGGGDAGSCVTAMRDGQLMVYAPLGSSSTSSTAYASSSAAHANSFASNVAMSVSGLASSRSSVAGGATQYHNDLNSSGFGGNCRSGSLGVVPSSASVVETNGGLFASGHRGDGDNRRTVFEYEFDEVHGPYR